MNFITRAIGWVNRAAFLFIILRLAALGDLGIVWACVLAYIVLACLGWIDLWPGHRINLLHAHKPDASHLRGASMATAAALRQMIRRRRHASTLTFGGVPVPVELEVQNVLLTGSPGTGKSTAITTALTALRARGDQMMIADIGGYYTQHYFQAGDVILNPLDARAVGWSPLAEMQSAWDAETLARSIIPDEPGDRGEWRHYARVVLASVLQRLWADGGNNGQLLHLSCHASMEELREAVTGLPAAALCAPENARMLANIHAILASYIGGLKFLHPETGRNGFSLRRWVHESGSGAAFFNAREDQVASLRSVIAAMADTVAIEVLSLPPSLDRRLWLILDEIHTYGRIGSLETYLTKGRKAGGCAIVGIQALSQLRTVYGEQEAQTLLTCLGNWLILRSADADTADYLSRALGDAELHRIMASGGTSGGGVNAGWQEQLASDRLVMPSELQHLPNFCGYIALAGDYPVVPIRLKRPRVHPVVAPFVGRALPQTQPPRQAPPASDPPPEPFAL
ncbi:MAG: type IV secretion system DNA-binding domain-containing protein [Metallibacterium scheffleri]|jgi:hypothetical protein|uniref:type IV secretion system DNA-binding domain-containing protein n=1 Tax=Metallibacterium scheffleri TaxID=993689 RepID=UPI0026F2EE87|nr:type IV secretion system DNA-binding domain-containing protein [Metallibacterium scheffleri]MCK9366795.1 type IV secretion system DNA-binding domain-containing protein [Metallibacterium scheffleri]